MTNRELKEYGFVYDRTRYCCNGQKNEIYRNGEYELRIRPKIQSFKIGHRGTFLDGFRPLTDLKTKLNEIFTNQNIHA